MKDERKRDIDVVLDEQGTLIHAEWELFEEETRTDVLEMIRKLYPDEPLISSTGMQEGTKTFLKIELKKNDGKSRYLIFDSDGKFIREK